MVNLIYFYNKQTYCYKIWEFVALWELMDDNP